MRSIILTEVPMSRASSKMETPGARALVAKVWRDSPTRAFGLRVRGEDTVGDAALGRDGPPGPVDVPPFECGPLVRPKAGLGGEHDERPEGVAKT